MGRLPKSKLEIEGMEIPKSSIDTSKSLKKRSWEENLAITLKIWADNSNSYSIEKFYLNQDIPKRVYYDAVNRNDSLRNAHEYALERIGINREERCIENNLNANHITAFTLPHYLNRYKEQIEFRASLHKENQDNRTQVVILEKFPDSPLVPEKKE